MTTETRTCTRCNQALPLHEFGKSTTTDDGLQPRCYSCNREAFHEKKERERQRAIEEIARTARESKHRITNASTREIYTTSSRAYYRNDGNKHIPSVGFPC